MGQKYAAYDASGYITAFYDEVDSPAPKGANTIKITDTEWQNCLATPGYTVESGTLVAPPVKSTAQLLKDSKTKQKAILKADCQKAILAGFPFTDSSGNNYTIKTDINNQINGGAAATTCKFGMADSTTWKASTPYAVDAVINDNGTYYIASTGGKSGSSSPAFPTAFGTSVTDGTVVWKLFGMLISTTNGKIWLKATDVVATYTAGVKFVLSQRSKLADLETQIDNATTVTAVENIIW